VVVEFIDDHRARFGVQPICTVLGEHGCKIAQSTYYAARSRPPSARSISDAALLIEISRVHSDPKIGRGLYGARKVWHQLRREGVGGGPLHGRAVDGNRQPARDWSWQAVRDDEVGPGRGPAAGPR